MKKLFKKILIIGIAASVALSIAGVFAFADTPTGGADEGGSASAVSKSEGSFEVTGYEIRNVGSSTQPSSLSKGGRADITLHMKYNSPAGSFDINTIDVARLVDSFSGGKAAVDKASATTVGSFAFDVLVTNLQYKGTGKSLKLMVSNNDTYQNIEVPISECKEYTEPADEPYTPSEPDPIPAPKVIMSRNELASDVKAGDELTLNISVTNIGKATINQPIISFTPSDCLLVTSSESAYQMKSIGVGKTETAQVKIRVLKPVTSANQYLDAKLEYTYYNRVSTVDGEASARINIPAKVKTTDNDESDDETANPVPNIIISKFSYGNSSVAAGSKFNLSFRFLNTSSKIAVENMVVTVEGGEGLTISGSSNTFFFDKLEAKGSQTVSLPMKASNTLTDGAQNVSVNFKYEYLDQKKRTPAAADIKISVPVYQPDRFDISEPVLPEYITEGEEIALTMNYVNKSKTMISNVEAIVEGEVQTQNAAQMIGNLEAGKNGTIAFAITPLSAGENSFTVTVNYEDGNGELKSRVFPVTMQVEEMIPYDPGMEEPGFEEPTDEGGFPWWIIVITVIAAGIGVLLVLKKRKKANAVKKEQELWDSWDDEMNENTAKESSESKGNKEE